VSFIANYNWSSFRWRYWSVISVFVLFVSILTVQAQSGSTDKTVVHPTAFDIASMSAVSGAQISPDGKTIIYALSTNSFDSIAKYDEDDSLGGWTMKQQLWSLGIENRRTKQLTYGEKDRSPQWSPDGRQIAFLRKKSDTIGLYIIAVDGGEGHKIDLGELEPSNHRWSPDGSTVAFTATVPRTNEEKEQKWRSGGMEVFEGEWRSSQIWTVSIEDGTVVQVTHGSDHVNDYRWSLDGSGFAVLIAESSDPYIAWTFLSPQMITTSGSLLKKLEPKPISATQIQFSPSGSVPDACTSRPRSHNRRSIQPG